MSLTARPMHPAIFAEFERLCVERRAGGRVLEIGAVPADDTLLLLPALATASFKVGVNLVAPSRHRDVDILQGNANAMPWFADASFDTVLSNATLEHDARFWLTLAEIRRVTRPGGLVMIGVPGYGATSFWSWLQRIMRRAPAVCRNAEPLLASTLTLSFHGMPGDYYRFSEMAVREQLLGGLVDRRVSRLLTPPRFIGAGRLP